jgi:NAD(P)H-nitrite reductase large subunit
MNEKKMSRNKTYNVLPGTSMGLLTTEYLEKLTEIAREHDIPFFKITSAQRLAIVGHRPETAEKVWQELGQKSGPKKPVGIHYIQACPGTGGKAGKSLQRSAPARQNQGRHIRLSIELL